MSRLLVIAWKELIQLRRDRLTMGMAVALPIMQLCLFGYAINTDVRHIPTVIHDQDRSAASRDLVAGLVQTGTFDVAGHVEDHARIEEVLRAGTAHAALVIPVGYGSDLQARRGTTVQLVVDGSDPQVVGSATSTAQAYVGARGADLATQRLPAYARGPAPLGMEANVLYNPEQRTALNIVPGLIGVILTLTMVMLTSMAIVRERERGTMEQLIVSPVRKLELVVGKLLPFIVIGYLQMTLVLLFGRFVFDVPIAGSLGLLYALASLFISANLALGLFFSTLAKTQQQAMQMSMFFVLPNILLSGFMFPFDAMPRPAQFLGQLLPLTHFHRIVRGIVLKSSTLADLGIEVVWLSGILVALVGFAAFRFDKKLL